MASASGRNSSRDRLYQTKTPDDTNSNLFLKIIDEGVNNIILDLKNALDGKNANESQLIAGTTQATNNAAKKVFEALNTIKTKITGYGVGNETLEKNLVDSVKDNGDSNTTIEDNNIDYNNKAHIHLHNNTHENTISDTRENVQKRINSCIRLEALYLKKHNEILNIFSFVLNLFDKYKYAIKVILYLLKNLVRPEDKKEFTSTGTDTGNDNPLNIRLPKPLIKNIDLLLTDQYKIQNVITNMKQTIDDNNFMTTDQNLDTAPAPGNIENINYPDKATATAAT